MSVKPVPRVRMPVTAKQGEIIEVRTLISHDMENGQRKDAAGKVVPRRIINRFVASFEGAEIMSVDWHPGVSANPYQAFFIRATKSGTFVFTWMDDDGSIYKAEQKLTVV